VSVFLFVSRTAGVLTSDISERPSCSVVVVAQRHGSGLLIGGLIVPPALAPCTYLHIASDDAARSDPSSRGQIASLKQHRRLCGQGVWSNVTIPPYNIGDRLARGCVLLSDVAMRLGSCNPSADLAFWVVTRRRLLQVAGRDCGLAFGVVVRGEAGCWRRRHGCGCGFFWPGLGSALPGARAGIISQVLALFFFAVGEKEEEMRHPLLQQHCMLGFALGVLFGERRAVDRIIVVKDHGKWSCPWLDRWMRA
jgi:hypothetical protein